MNQAKRGNREQPLEHNVLKRRKENLRVSKLDNNPEDPVCAFDLLQLS